MSEGSSHAGCARKCAGLAAGTGRNASLACVRSRADNDFVARDLGANKEPTWIGLTQRMDANGEALATRDGWDQWASGCEDEVPTGAYRYTNWAASEPNDWGGNGEDCAVTGLEQDSLWYDAPCSLEDPRCLCEWPATTSAAYTASIRFREEDGEKGGDEGPGFGAILGGISLATLVPILAIHISLSVCLLCKGCAWRDYVVDAAPQLPAAVFEAPRVDFTAACAKSDHHAARAAHAGRRVATEAFDCIRGFGALQVMLGHFYTYWCHEASGLELGGGNAVLMFFLMSGFIMQVGYAGKGPADGGCCCGCCFGCGGAFAKSFWARRLARIGPIVWLSLVLYLPIAWFELGELPGLLKTFMLIAAFIIESIFAQGYVGVGLINGPLWSVCAQWFFYWLFPLLTDRIHRKRTGGEIALWSLLYVVAYVVSWLGFALLTGGGSVYGGYLQAHLQPVQKLPLFLLGMMFGSEALLRSADATPRAPFKWKMIADGCTAAVALYTIYQGTATRLTGDPLAGFNSRIYGELAFPMLYVIWLFALTQAPTSLSYRVFTWTPFRRLGDYSFALYCLHFPVLHYYAWARYGGEYWGHKNRGGALLHSWEVFPCLVLLLAVAAAAYYLIERPCRTRLYAWLMSGMPAHGAAGGARTAAAVPSPLLSEGDSTVLMRAQATGTEMQEASESTVYATAVVAVPNTAVLPTATATIIAEPMA